MDFKQAENILKNYFDSMEKVYDLERYGFLENYQEYLSNFSPSFLNFKQEFETLFSLLYDYESLDYVISGGSLITAKIGEDFFKNSGSDIDIYVHHDSKNFLKYQYVLESLNFKQIFSSSIATTYESDIYFFKVQIIPTYRTSPKTIIKDFDIINCQISLGKNFLFYNKVSLYLNEKKILRLDFKNTSGETIKRIKKYTNRGFSIDSDVVNAMLLFFTQNHKQLFKKSYNL